MDLYILTICKKLPPSHAEAAELFHNEGFALFALLPISILPGQVGFLASEMKNG